MDFETLLQLLQSGADGATIAIAWALWRIDRRVYRLEISAGVIE